LYVPANQFIAAAKMLVLRTTEPVGRVAEIARRSLARWTRVWPSCAFWRQETLDKPLARPRFTRTSSSCSRGRLFCCATIASYRSSRRPCASGMRRSGSGWPWVPTAPRTCDGSCSEKAFVCRAGRDRRGGALLAGRLVRELLYEVQPHDPLSLAAARGCWSPCRPGVVSAGAPGRAPGRHGHAARGVRRAADRPRRVARGL